MERDVVEKIMKECNWWERIIIKVFKKIFIKVYKIGVKVGFNWDNIIVL